MFVLGLLLAAASAALAVEVVVSNTDNQTIEAFNRSAELTIGTLFVGGVVTALVFALGLAMFISGLRSTWHERRSQRHAAKQTRDSIAALQAENRRLQADLEKERARSPIQPVSPGQAGPGGYDGGPGDRGSGEEYVEPQQRSR